MTRTTLSRRRWGFRLLALVLGFLMILPICELAIRLALTVCFHNRLNPSTSAPRDFKKEIPLGKLMKADPNPKLLFRLWPGTQAAFHGARVEINAMGFRDDLVTTVKPPRTLRVLGLGDSTMFGFGVAHEECYLELLEAEFRCLLRGRWNVEFVDAAAPAYNSTQEAELFFQTGLKLDPDAVLIQFDGNDPEVPLGYPLKPDFLFSRYIFLAHIPAILSGGCFDCRAFYMLDQRDRLYDPKYPYAGWTAVREAYRRLAEVCRERKIPLFGLLICEDTPPLTGPEKLDLAHKRILDIWGELGITTIQAYHKVKAEAVKNQRDWLQLTNNWQDPHPNAVGQALIAQAALPQMRDMLLAKAGLKPADLEAYDGLGNIVLRRITGSGLHQIENWDGYVANWTAQTAHFHFIPGGRRAVVPLMVSHPDVSPAKPVEITLRIDGTPTSRHPDAIRIARVKATKAGYLSQEIDIGDLDGCPLELTVSVDRTFVTDTDPRGLGVGIYNLAFKK